MKAYNPSIYITRHARGPCEVFKSKEERDPLICPYTSSGMREDRLKYLKTKNLGGDMPVLLGMVDARLEVSHVTDYTTNKVGGIPDWSSSCLGVSSPCCGLCGRPSPLVVQVYCPLSCSPYHRTLYVFACTNRPCWNHSESWTVLRSQQLDATNIDSSHSKTNKNDDDIDWGGDADNWGDDATGGDVEEMVTTAWREAAEDWGEEGGNVWGGYDDNTGTNTPPPKATNSQDQVVTELTGGGQSDLTITTQVERLQNMSLTDAVVGVGVTGEQGMGSDDNRIAECIMVEGVPSQPVWENLRAILNISRMEETGPDTTQPQSKPPSTSTEVLTPYYVNVFVAPTGWGREDYRHEDRLLAAYAQREGLKVKDLLTSYISTLAIEITTLQGLLCILDNYTLKLQVREDGGGGKEGYEKVAAHHGDRTFHKFTKQLQTCPNQIIRYEHAGTPVLMRPLSSPAAPCPACGQPRVYEMQLMPALLPLLTSSCTQGTALEFGTVLIYTCRGSCWSDDVTTPRPEHVIVQADPDAHLFR